jgi:polyvinyl alcohol dehydrogenase (cytochrome)
MTYPLRGRVSRLLTVAVGATALLAGVAVQTASAASQGNDWPSAGQGVGNSRNQSSTPINSANASTLHIKWTASTHGDVSATPSEFGGVVYFPDWGGYLNAVNANTGATLWSFPISNYDGVAGSVARDTPTVFGNSLILGDQNGAHVFSVNRNTGALQWVTQVDSHPLAVITSNPVVAGNDVYIGVASLEEGAAADPSYPCCTFRGSLVKLNVNTGALEWKTYTIPDNGGAPGGYSGGAVWDTPSINPSTGLVYFGTGNNYTVPDSVTACEDAASPPGSGNCTAADDLFDAMVAVDMKTGAVAWSSKTLAYDAWSVACFFLPPGVTWCPSPEGPDYDMGGAGPNVLTVKIGNTPRDVVGIGQKSGFYWMFDAKTGQLLWKTLVGPGSALGGMEWGTATDGSHIYVNIGNLYGIPYHPTQNGVIDTSVTLTGGSFAALDPATGMIQWQTGDPTGNIDIGAVSSAGGVVFSGSMDGTMYALNGNTGAILWSYASGASVNSGPAIVGNNVYWGTGYSHLGLGTGGVNKLFDFAVN